MKTIHQIAKKNGYPINLTEKLNRSKTGFQTKHKTTHRPNKSKNGQYLNTTTP
jgi:hypothetical protein